jgi:hypothetical protein
MEEHDIKKIGITAIRLEHDQGSKSSYHAILSIIYQQDLKKTTTTILIGSTHRFNTAS